MSETIEKIFDTIVQKEGSFTFVAIPFSPRDVWGEQPRFHVTGTIHGMPVRGTLGALGQDHFLRLGAKWMQDCGIEPAANVTVQLSLEGPQEGNISSDISKALSGKKKQKYFLMDYRHSIEKTSLDGLRVLNVSRHE